MALTISVLAIPRQLGSFCRKCNLHIKAIFSSYPHQEIRSPNEGVHIHTIRKDGKIVEHKAIRDDLKFMMQLGAIKLAPEFEPYIKGWKGTG